MRHQWMMQISHISHEHSSINLLLITHTHTHTHRQAHRDTHTHKHTHILSIFTQAAGGHDHLLSAPPKGDAFPFTCKPNWAGTTPAGVVTETGQTGNPPELMAAISNTDIHCRLIRMLYKRMLARHCAKTALPHKPVT